MSVEIIHCICGPGPGAEAALSQSLQQGLDKLIPANLPTFDPLHHQLQVPQQRRIHHACCIQRHPFQKPFAAWYCLRVVRAGWCCRQGDAGWLTRFTAGGLCGSIRKIDQLPARGKRFAGWLSGFTVAAIRGCGIIRWGKIGKTDGLAAPGLRGRLLPTTALAVASFFVLSSLGRLRVLGTTTVRAFPSMLLPAAERAE